MSLCPTLFTIRGTPGLEKHALLSVKSEEKAASLVFLLAWYHLLYTLLSAHHREHREIPESSSSKEGVGGHWPIQGLRRAQQQLDQGPFS